MDFSVENVKSIICDTLSDAGEFVYLMGSAGTDRFHDESDIDIAVYWKPNTTEEEKASIRNNLMAIFDREIDLVALNRIDIIFARKVLETGRLLFNKSPGLHLLWCSEKLSEYPDFKKSRKIIEDNLLQRKKYV